MKDIDGYLRPAECAFEMNHSRARCPKCKIFGQFSRDSSAGSRRYKCRTPACNKTMGCKEFYQRYRTKYRPVQPCVEEEERVRVVKEHMKWHPTEGASDERAGAASKRARGTRQAQIYKIAKRQVHNAAQCLTVPTLYLDGKSIRSSRFGYITRAKGSCEPPNSSTIIAAAMDRHNGLYRKRIIGPAHPANMGISILREGARQLQTRCNACGKPQQQLSAWKSACRCWG